MKENIYSAHKMNELQLHKSQLHIEYNSLKQYCPSGIYVLPSLSNINIWQGVIFLRQGYFKDAIFRFKIEIPQDYPASAPSIYFHNFIFHPLISPATGELSIISCFPSWRPGKDFIFSLLAYMKKIFYFTDSWTTLQSVQNPQALDAFLQDEMLFIHEARSCVIESNTLSYADSQNGEIRFKQFNSLHSVVLKNIQESKDNPMAFMKFFREQFI